MSDILYAKTRTRVCLKSRHFLPFLWLMSNIKEKGGLVKIKFSSHQKGRVDTKVSRAFTIGKKEICLFHRTIKTFTTKGNTTHRCCLYYNLHGRTCTSNLF